MANIKQRYEKQIMIPEIGSKGQSRLARSTVLVAGAGGLGSAVLFSLAGAGVGKIIVADGDKVSLSNLNRQFLYTEGDIGKNKAEAAALRLSRYNSDIEIIPFDQYITSENACILLEKVNLAVLALDSIPARLVINRACHTLGIPLVNGGINGFYGEIMNVNPGHTPCLECWYGNDIMQNPAGAVGAVASAVASIMANLSLLILLGHKCPAENQVLIYDGMRLTVECADVEKSANCSSCLIL